jgi:hypothetical protein
MIRPSNPQHLRDQLSRIERSFQRAFMASVNETLQKKETLLESAEDWQILVDGPAGRLGSLVGNSSLARTVLGPGQSNDWKHGMALLIHVKTK